MMMPSRRALAAGAIVCAGIAPVARAITILPTFQNNSAYGTLGTWTTTEEQVVNEAISDWEGRIQDNHSINITFAFTNIPTTQSGSYLAQWNGNYSAIPNGSNIYPWTPGVMHVVDVNTAFMNSSLTNQLKFTTGTLNANDWDALSVLRHELGHAMGFVTNFYWDDVGQVGQVDKWASNINSSNVFNAGGLNVQMEADHQHTANVGVTANDLMNASIVNGIRRGISTTDLQMLELAYHYDMVPGDATHDGTVNLADFLALVRNFGQPGGSWDVGDFNFDGTTNLSDLLTLTRDFGKTISTYAFPPQLLSTAITPALASDSNQTSVSVALLPAQVPEPAALGLAAIGVLALLPRSRRAVSI